MTGRWHTPLSISAFPERFSWKEKTHPECEGHRPRLAAPAEQEGKTELQSSTASCLALQCGQTQTSHQDWSRGPVLLSRWTVVQNKSSSLQLDFCQIADGNKEKLINVPSQPVPQSNLSVWVMPSLTFCTDKMMAAVGDQRLLSLWVPLLRACPLSLWIPVATASGPSIWNCRRHLSYHPEATLLVSFWHPNALSNCSVLALPFHVRFVLFQPNSKLSKYFYFFTLFPVLTANLAKISRGHPDRFSNTWLVNLPFSFQLSLSESLGVWTQFLPIPQAETMVVCHPSPHRVVIALWRLILMAPARSLLVCWTLTGISATLCLQGSSLFLAFFRCFYDPPASQFRTLVRSVRCCPSDSPTSQCPLFHDSFLW